MTEIQAQLNQFVSKASALTDLVVVAFLINQLFLDLEIYPHCCCSVSFT
tara:strand:+ start:761 stop:907 length:147 start_codon:yes stop_codon:yes gene_type:complete